MRYAVEVTRMGEVRNAHKIVVGKPKERGPPGSKRVDEELNEF
jgi:hypothetical protein